MEESSVESLDVSEYNLYSSGFYHVNIILNDISEF